MKLKYLKNNLIDYLFFVFVLISFYLYTISKETGLLYYYFAIILFISISKLSKFGFIRFINLNFTENKKELLIHIILIILVSNFILLFIRTNFFVKILVFKNSFDINYGYHYFLFSSIRFFGEELFFRGLLLIKDVKSDFKTFWFINILQSILFGIIHSLFVDEVLIKIAFFFYAFTLSIIMGLINKKYDSLLPSWLIHFANGFQNFIFYLN